MLWVPYVDVRLMKRIAVAFSRLMLRTSSSPLKKLWGLAYWSVVQAAVASIRRQYRDAAIYLKGSFATREEIHGISDVDLVVVLPDDGTPQGSAQLTAREYWKQVLRRFPLFGLVVQHCWFYEEDDLRETLKGSCLTNGLASNDDNDSADRAVFLGPNPLHDHMGLQAHPSVYGPRNEWRNLGSKDCLPRSAPHDAQSRRLAAWLDLQYWWRYAFQACAEPEREHVPLLCVKLVAEPMRLLLWAERGEQVTTREAALRRGLDELPEEREMFELGLRLLKALPNSPRPPLREVIDGLFRQTERLSAHMSSAADAAGWVDVKLAGRDELHVTPDLGERMRSLRARGESVELLPLADWRARAVPGLPDESMILARAGEMNPTFLAAMANADHGEAISAFRYNNMLVMPTLDSERGTLRAVQCLPSDPVSFALADGQRVARFPELAGWSAMHCARRAVAEHRGWLEATDWTYPPHGWVGVQSAGTSPHTRTLGLLFTAARAALFLESVNDGRPELAVTVAGVADSLIARDSTCTDVVSSALDHYRSSRADKLDHCDDPRSVAAMLEVVRNLPSYAGSSALSPAA